MTTLRQQLINVLTLKGYAARTLETYVESVAGLAKYYGQSPAQLSDQQVQDYLLHLHARGLSASTLNVRLSGLRFFYQQVLERPWTIEALPRPKPAIRRARVYGAQVVVRGHPETAASTDRTGHFVTIRSTERRFSILAPGFRAEHHSSIFTHQGFSSRLVPWVFRPSIGPRELPPISLDDITLAPVR